jgi:hypothetical protein
MGYPSYWCEKFPHLAARNQVHEESQDVQYMGGSQERGAKRAA